MEMKVRKDKKNKLRLSVIIVAKNEGKKVEDCLKSITWADEIVFVDTGSFDATKNIAKKYTSSIYDFSEGSYDAWRNYGLKKAKGDWVLYVDADERIPRSLKDEILNIVSSATTNNVGVYAIPRLNIILGKEMRHGGWWPDYVKRLYLKKRLVKWINPLHEEPVFKGRMKHLKNYMIHLKHDNLSEMVEKTNKWSYVEAKTMYEANHPPMNIFRFGSAMFREFWLRLVVNKSFMDGSEGTIYAFYQVWSRFLSYAKLWEMQLKNK